MSYHTYPTIPYRSFVRDFYPLVSYFFRHHIWTSLPPGVYQDCHYRITRYLSDAHSPLLTTSEDRNDFRYMLPIDLQAHSCLYCRSRIRTYKTFPVSWSWAKGVAITLSCYNIEWFLYKQIWEDLFVYALIIEPLANYIEYTSTAPDGFGPSYTGIKILCLPAWRRGIWNGACWIRTNQNIDEMLPKPRIPSQQLSSFKRVICSW